MEVESWIEEEKVINIDVYLLVLENLDEKILILSKDDIEIEEKVISKDFVKSYIK